MFPSVLQPTARSESATIAAPAPLQLNLPATFYDRLFWLVGLGASAWIVAFMTIRVLQQYPLDAFEEYQLQKAIHWANGAALYGAAGEELWPEAYPPLYFYTLGIWQRWFGQTFLVQRSISVIALAGIAGCGFWTLRDAPDRSRCYLAFFVALLSLDSLAGKSFTVGKPDTMFTLFVALAIVTSQHRSSAEIVASSLGLWLASLTKQNALLFLAPLIAWHLVQGSRRWAILWGAAMVALIAATYGALDWQSNGNFSRWVFVWTAGHGVDLIAGVSGTIRAMLLRSPLVLGVLAGSLVWRPRCIWTWCLVTALGLAVMGMSKSGGRENHLMPAAFMAALIAGKEFNRMWQVRNRWLVATIVLVTIVVGVPTRRDFRWMAKRNAEANDWVAAVQHLNGSVAVSHHMLLARRADAACFFSDLILEFRGLGVPAVVARRIADKEFDFLLLCDDPSSSATREWSRLMEQHYVPAGDLEFRNVSRVLPLKVFRRRE